MRPDRSLGAVALWVPPKKMDDYLLVALPRFLKIAEKQKLAPHAAIKSLLSDVHNYEGATVFRDKFGQSVELATRRLYRKNKDGKRRRQLEQAAADL